MKTLIAWTWCFPQSIVGFFVYLAVRKIIRKTTRHDGIIYIEMSDRANFAGVALGYFIFLKEKQFRLRHLKHEQGHARQGYRLGWLYLPLVGLLSARINIKSKRDSDYKTNYFKKWPENWADKLGKVTNEDREDKSKAYYFGGRWCSYKKRKRKA